MSSDLLQSAREALERGERIHARKLVRAAILQNPHSEQAWLLMARLVDQPEQVLDCLEQAHKLNPQNQSTFRALRALRRDRSQPSGTGVPRPPSTQPTPPQQAVAPSIPSLEPAKTHPPAATRLAEEAPGPVKRISHHPTANWSLIIGSLLVLLVVAIGVAGPLLAPADPLEENTIVKVGDKWETPPFAPFSVPGFMLGSDQFGRDLLSRILWGVRPTMTMVATVAVVRLFLGTLIGLGAGWFTNRFGRWLDTLISGALAVPVLIIALGAIAMLGADLGLVAFIVGLSLNGWGETARIVRDQTQTIKSQLYIEAAQALGASSFSILSRHILRQIMPMVWMLFAFEISNTLMTTAGLGFLGYYIGGDVWIEVSDFVSRRVSGMPELGQMLATAWTNLIQPWPLVITGSVIFVAVLGFNLMGEGLRTRLNPELINRSSLASRFGRWFSAWFEQSVTHPSGTWLRRSLLHPLMVGFVVLGLAGILYGMHSLLTGGASSTALSIPGGHYWAAERGDAPGSLSSAEIGPLAPQLLWTIHSDAEFTGGPAVAADGTVYVLSASGRLLALEPDGATRWEITLPEPLSGTPALAPDGTVYVTSSSGSLYAIAPNGELLWSYQAGTPATNYHQVRHGPVVSRTGVVYFLVEDTRGDTLLAFSPQGKLLWQTSPGTQNAATPPRLSPDEEHIFVQNVMLNATDGSLVELTLPSSEDVVLGGREQYAVGGNGLLYLHVGHYLMQWVPSPSGMEVVQTGEWNYRGAGLSQYSAFPVDAGATRNGTMWLFYSAYYGGTNVVWLDATGKTLGSSTPPMLDNSRLVGVDGKNMAYLCGLTVVDNEYLRLICQAYAAGSEEPTWQVELDDLDQTPVGGALAPGRLYLTTSGGVLYALGDP